MSSESRCAVAKSGSVRAAGILLQVTGILLPVAKVLVAGHQGMRGLGAVAVSVGALVCTLVSCPRLGLFCVMPRRSETFLVIRGVVLKAYMSRRNVRGCGTASGGTCTC